MNQQNKLSNWNVSNEMASFHAVCRMLMIIYKSKGFKFFVSFLLSNGDYDRMKNGAKYKR